MLFSSSLYFKGKGGEVDLGEKEGGKGTRRCGGKGNYSQNVMYERRLKVKKNRERPL